MKPVRALRFLLAALLASAALAAPIGIPIPKLKVQSRVTLSMTVETAIDSVDVREFDVLALNVKATRNSGAETVEVFREEARDGKNFVRMESLGVFAGSGSLNARIDLRHRLWRLAFVPSGACDYSMEVGWTVRPRRGHFKNYGGGFQEI